jgi:hypothetical protein
MSDIARLLLLAALLCVCSVPVRAEGGLQGLEMDVMNPGENAARATARIALPRMALPAPTEQDLPGIESERNARAADLFPDGGASVAREASPVVDPVVDPGTEASNPPR